MSISCNRGTAGRFLSGGEVSHGHSTISSDGIRRLVQPGQVEAVMPATADQVNHAVGRLCGGEATGRFGVGVDVAMHLVQAERIGRMVPTRSETGTFPFLARKSPSFLARSVAQSPSTGWLRWNTSGSTLPVWNLVAVPARQAYSHSASVGNRYGLPSFFVSHSQKATASCQLT